MKGEKQQHKDEQQRNRNSHRQTSFSRFKVFKLSAIRHIVSGRKLYLLVYLLGYLGNNGLHISVSNVKPYRYASFGILARYLRRARLYLHIGHLFKRNLPTVG